MRRDGRDRGVLRKWTVHARKPFLSPGDFNPPLVLRPLEPLLVSEGESGSCVPRGEEPLPHCHSLASQRPERVCSLISQIF